MEAGGKDILALSLKARTGRCCELGSKAVGGVNLDDEREKYIFPFEKLEVWHLSVALSEFVLGLLERIPPNKHLRLCGQMESAVVSTAQNIAEGKGRQYKREFIQYLHISQGSLYEVVTLAEIFRSKRLFEENDALEVRIRCEAIDRKLNGLINSLQGKLKKSE